MSRFYVQREAGIRETGGAVAVAVAVALGVGGLSFYLVRMFLAREDLESEPPPHVARRPGRSPRVENEGVR